MTNKKGTKEAFGLVEGGMDDPVPEVEGPIYWDLKVSSSYLGIPDYTFRRQVQGRLITPIQSNSLRMYFLRSEGGCKVSDIVWP